MNVNAIENLVSLFGVMCLLTQARSDSIESNWKATATAATKGGKKSSNKWLNYRVDRSRARETYRFAVCDHKFLCRCEWRNREMSHSDVKFINHFLLQMRMHSNGVRRERVFWNSFARLAFSLHKWKQFDIKIIFFFVDFRRNGRLLTALNGDLTVVCLPHDIFPFQKLHIPRSISRHRLNDGCKEKKVNVWPFD